MVVANITSAGCIVIAQDIACIGILFAMVKWNYLLFDTVYNYAGSLPVYTNVSVIVSKIIKEHVSFNSM